MAVSTEYRHHARAGIGEALAFRTACRYHPAYEGLARGFVVQRMMAATERKQGDGILPLIRASAERLDDTERGLEKWRYTKRHCIEVGYFAYLIAREAKQHGVHEAAGLDPKLCFAGDSCTTSERPSCPWP